MSNNCKKNEISQKEIMEFLNNDWLVQKMKKEHKNVSPKRKFCNKEIITIVVFILTLILIFKVL